LLWLSVGGSSVITPVKAQSDRVYVAGWISPVFLVKLLNRSQRGDQVAFAGRVGNRTLEQE
jgi:hypothetical protein